MTANDELPSMSRKSIEKAQEKPPVQAITKAVRHKSIRKPFLVRFAEENGKKAVQDILWDVLIPAIKTTVVDMVNNGLEAIFYGENSNRSPSRNRTRDRNRTIISYGNYYTRNNPKPIRRRREDTGRAIDHNFEDIVIPTRAEAEEVLDTLSELIESYGEASVSDFYKLVGIQPHWTDRKWGWTSFERPGVLGVKGGYILDIPKPIELD